MNDARDPLRPFARAWFCYFAAMGVYSLFAPLWFSRLGLSALAIGAIASLQSWTRVFAPYGWAWMADHGNRRQQLLQWAGALSAGSSLALALTGQFGMAAVSLWTPLAFPLSYNGSSRVHFICLLFKNRTPSALRKRSIWSRYAPTLATSSSFAGDTMRVVNVAPTSSGAPSNSPPPVTGISSPRLISGG